MKTCLFFVKTLLFYYIHMMMVHLSQTLPNMSSIEAVCDSLGKTFLTLLVSNLGATGGLSCKGQDSMDELRQGKRLHTVPCEARGRGFFPPRRFLLLHQPLGNDLT